MPKNNYRHIVLPRFLIKAIDRVIRERYAEQNEADARLLRAWLERGLHLRLKS